MTDRKPLDRNEARFRFFAPERPAIIKDNGRGLEIKTTYERVIDGEGAQPKELEK